MAHIKQFEHLKIQLEAITSATNNFSDDNCIGGGGFGKVYKGEIDHSKGHPTMVALKRLDRKFGQGDPEFWKEIMTLSLHRHENIISLLGYCDDYGEKILMYEYASKSSLDRYLSNNDLSWVQRLKICIGAARGLAYLHSPMESKERVLHRDIKSSNILLDENWNAKISDFGLSKFGPANLQYTFLFSNAVGTIGYCDPVYVETCFLTKESDVYSFGVVLFEVLCGRLCIGNNNDKNRPLTGLARQCYEQGKLDEIIFGKIKDEINPESLKVFSTIAYRCLNVNREERPLMTEIVSILETALEYQEPIQHQVPNMSLLPRTPDGGGFLTVTIHEAYDLNGKHPFILLRVRHGIRRTTTVKNNQNPVWHEKFTFTLDKSQTNAMLHLVVCSSSWMDKYLKQDPTLGDVDISIADVVKEKHIDKIYHIRKGRVHVELQWEASALPVKTKSKMSEFLTSVYNLS